MTRTNRALASGEPLPFGQLQIEIHIWNNLNKPFAEFFTWWKTLDYVLSGLRQVPVLSVSH